LFIFTKKTMRKLKFFVLIQGFLFTMNGCVQEDTRPDCEKNDWGTVEIDSYLADPYKVYIDGMFKGRVVAYGLADFSNVSSGSRTIKLVQESGYILYPTEYTYSATVSDCNTSTVTLQ
jgi:hypothetical protein